jgi:hypothetical protein
MKKIKISAANDVRRCAPLRMHLLALCPQGQGLLLHWIQLLHLLPY